MPKENPLRALLGQLNREYSLSEEFRTRVSQLIDRLEGLNLPPEQIEVLLGKVRETYERQRMVESCREESLKSLSRIHSAIAAYSNALNTINLRLNQAETALEKLLASSPAACPVGEDKAVVPQNKDKARALAAFASIDSKNSRIN